MARSDQQKKQTESEENQSSVTVKRGEQKIVEEKDKWVKVRATMDSGAAGHVMPEAMFTHVQIGT